MRFIQLISVALICVSISCSSEEKKVNINEEGIEETITANESYRQLGKLLLSEYEFFTGDLADLIPSNRVFAYELNSPLFTDYASKARFIYLPERSQIQYVEDIPLHFPVGTVLIKNFFYTADDLKSNSRKIIETRLLLHHEEGWQALPYIWNKEQTEAFLEITGGNITIEHKIQGDFSYSVPTMNQCKSCHETKGKITPIGPSVRQLDRDEQLENLLELKLIDRLVEKDKRPQIAQWDNPNENLNDRARAYLDINCAHCHRDDGPAKNSGLSLRYNELDSFTLGIMKRPVAAGKGSGGFAFDILPGKPEESILVHRMKINDPGTRMPELGRNLIHKEGVELIENWIKGLKD